MSVFKSNHIANILDGEHRGNIVDISNFTSLSLARSDSITFYNDISYKNDLINSAAGVVILKISDAQFRNGTAIIVKDPYVAYAKISTLFQKKPTVKSGISPNTVIADSAKLGKDIYIGANTVIGENSTINNFAQIGENVFIGENVQIGQKVIIHPHSTIHNDVIIGDNSEIFSGARIGTDGFGYAKNEQNKWIKIPQTGSVVIGDNVDIGANTTIDRGAIENTIIHSGVKIDNQVQIGHNCIIGENTIIAGCTGIAGSTKIGKNCMIGGACMIKGHLDIADDTIISGGTGIGKSISIPGKRFTNVFPYNIEHKDWLRIAHNLKNIGKKND